MKNYMKSVLTLLIAFSVIACKNANEPEVIMVENETAEVATANPDAHYAKAEFGIDGMTCAIGCAKSIERKLAKMDGVKSAKVDFDNRIAMVEYDEELVTPTSLEATVASVGEDYKVNDMKTVESFSEEKKACTMACCEGKTAKEKESCKMMCCESNAEHH